MLLILVIGVAWLAWSNGANDNFKGVATLYGSDVVGFRTALTIATICTLGGSLVSLMLAGRLAEAFGGAGLVSAELAGTTPFVASVAIAAAATIFVATLLGMPTSTTHALTGALAGVALAGGSAVDGSRLATGFLLPLALSPLLAVAVTATALPAIRTLRSTFGWRDGSCVCIDRCAPSATRVPVALSVASAPVEGAIALRTGDSTTCIDDRGAPLPGVRLSRVGDTVHALSGGAVCFARAVNDTPKIAALLLVLGATVTMPALLLVSVAMALGGVLQARRVAETMSRRITPIAARDGLGANLATAGLVLGASGVGLPVATTHVSCGAIFGIGLARRSANPRTILGILAAWLTTMPLAAMLGMAIARSLAVGDSIS